MTRGALAELSRLRRAAEDRGAPIGGRIAACRALLAPQWPQATRDSAAEALRRLGDDPDQAHCGPDCEACADEDPAAAVEIPRELAERLDHDLGALKHLTPAERELWGLLRRELGR